MRYSSLWPEARVVGELYGLPLVEYSRAPDDVLWFPPGASYVLPEAEHILIRSGAALMARNLADAYRPEGLTSLCARSVG